MYKCSVQACHQPASGPRLWIHGIGTTVSGLWFRDHGFGTTVSGSQFEDHGTWECSIGNVASDPKMRLRARECGV